MHDTAMMMDPNKSKEVAGLTVGLIGLGLMGTPMVHNYANQEQCLEFGIGINRSPLNLHRSWTIYMSAKHHAMFPKRLVLQY